MPCLYSSSTSCPHEALKGGNMCVGHTLLFCYLLERWITFQVHDRLAKLNDANEIAKGLPEAPSRVNVITGLPDGHPEWGC